MTNVPDSLGQSLRKFHGVDILLKSFGIMLLLLPTAQATVDNWDVEGANGTLYVYGTLTESACRLEMLSAWQDVMLGEIGTGRLLSTGERGEPVHFELRLTDCLRSPAGSLDHRTGSLWWSNNQPAVTVSFIAPRDRDNPQLVKLDGVAGIGLRVRDEQGNDVRIGNRGMPLFLTPGQDSLGYTVSTERTSAAMIAGNFKAVIGFQLSYD